MLGHLGINVSDLGAAKRYYDDVLPWLDYEQFFSTESECAYQPTSGTRGAFLFFYPAPAATAYSRQDPGVQHLAFIVPTRSAVRAVHQHIVELGGEVMTAPQDFPQYPPPYFATFWSDPFGLMLEAVCHHDRE